eukprot:4431737-Pleurochrysis_carterae.AAC.1
MEEYRESFLQQPALKFATGVEEAYANLDVMAVELREKEALARSGKEIAELFDFPEASFFDFPATPHTQPHT